MFSKEKKPQQKQEQFKPQRLKENNMKIKLIIQDLMLNKIQDIIEQVIQESKKISLKLIKEEVPLKKQRKLSQRNMSLLKKNTKKKLMILTKEKIKLKQKPPKIKESMILINIILIEIIMQEIIKVNINKKQKKLKKLNFPRKTIIYSMIQIIAQFMAITVKEIKQM